MEVEKTIKQVWEEIWGEPHLEKGQLQEFETMIRNTIPRQQWTALDELMSPVKDEKVEGILKQVKTKTSAPSLMRLLMKQQLIVGLHPTQALLTAANCELLKQVLLGQQRNDHVRA